MDSNQDRSNRGGSSKGSGGKEMEYPGMDLSPPGFPNGYKKFIWHGSRVYKYSNAPPHIVFKLGWRETDGYDDIVRHITDKQGEGSIWISTSSTITGGEGYGDFIYVIELKNNYKAVDGNLAFQTLQGGHRNPHAHQMEISIYQVILPEEVIGVWIPRKLYGLGPHQHQLASLVGYQLADLYDYCTKRDYLLQVEVWEAEQKQQQKHKQKK